MAMATPKKSDLPKKSDILNNSASLRSVYYPREDAKIYLGAVAFPDSRLVGEVEVELGSAVYPNALIVADAGPVIIGESNIIKDHASIIHRSTDADKDEPPVPLNIGENNLFEKGCEIHAKSIGEYNVFGPECYIGPEVEIGIGCVIDAGCRVTAPGKLPDWSVVSGFRTNHTLTLDEPMETENLSRQQDELSVMKEIFITEFSTFSSKGEVYVKFEAQPVVPSNIKLTLMQPSGQPASLTVRHLPPIQLVASLPKDYPSDSPPDFTISCSWLSTFRLRLLIEGMKKSWYENKSEILYTWCSFLQEQCLDVLNITNVYELSEKEAIPRLHGTENYSLHNHEPDNCSHFNNDVKEEAIPRLHGTENDSLHNHETDNCSHFNNNVKEKAIPRLHGTENDSLHNHLLDNCSHFNNDVKEENNRSDRVRQMKELRELGDLRDTAKEILTMNAAKIMETGRNEGLAKLYYDMMDYNICKEKEKFNRSLQDCNTCFYELIGRECKQLSCGHITCNECLKGLCEVYIEQGLVRNLVCCQTNCGLELPPSVIKELVSKDTYEKYDQLMLNRALDEIPNITYCPRRACQYPAPPDDGDSISICPSCGYAFCIYCRRGTHGIEPCRMDSKEKAELIDAYKNADSEKKIQLEKRYGKKHLMELVSTAATEEWMSENSKPCPCCKALIEKNDGCNKMICRKCNANFCWLCLTRVPSLNPYLHFQDPNSPCYNLLFEGVNIDDQQLFLEEGEEMLFLMPEDELFIENDLMGFNVEAEEGLNHENGV